MARNPIDCLLNARLASNRREFIKAAAALAFGSACLPSNALEAPPHRFKANPFALGVASGYPLPAGIVLWTRLVPEPQMPGGGMPASIIPVRWEMAADERFAKTVDSGTAYATPEWAHSVHVEVSGLQPARHYWYRFIAGGIASPVGRTRTAPPAGAPLQRFRLAFASCQHFEQGYFCAYRHMLEDDLDLVVHLGDYIYESSWGRDPVRRHNGSEPHTLDDYRIRYAQYRGDPDLQAAHAAYPWMVTWDDHEVDNDYADDRSQDNDDPAWFLLRRAAAYKAYYEHMPLRRQMVPFGPHMRLFTHASFGDLVGLHMLDDRQYRSHQPCSKPGSGGSNVVEDCAQRLDPKATLLGETQERWLDSALANSKAKWNVIAQQTLIAQLDRKPGEGQQFWTDGWDGYPAARRRLLDSIVQRKAANPITIGGDIHSFWVTDLKPDFDDPASPVVATEFVGTSISSQARPQKENEKLMPDNPHIRYAMSDYRGYTRMEFTARQLRTDLRALNTVKRRDSPCRTLETFIVEDGKPGAVKG
jgi:alkaline phosphatase D